MVVVEVMVVVNQSHCVGDKEREKTKKNEKLKLVKLSKSLIRFFEGLPQYGVDPN